MEIIEKELSYEIIGIAMKIYNDKVIGDYIADLLIEEKLIIELKAIEKLSKVHEAQLLN